MPDPSDEKVVLRTLKELVSYCQEENTTLRAILMLQGDTDEMEFEAFDQVLQDELGADISDVAPALKRFLSKNEKDIDVKKLLRMAEEFEPKNEIAVSVIEHPKEDEKSEDFAASKGPKQGKDVKDEKDDKDDKEEKENFDTKNFEETTLIRGEKFKADNELVTTLPKDEFYKKLTDSQLEYSQEQFMQRVSELGCDKIPESQISSWFNKRVLSGYEITNLMFGNDYRETSKDSLSKEIDALYTKAKGSKKDVGCEAALALIRDLGFLTEGSKVRQLFASCDGNNKGKLTPAEFEVFIMKFVCQNYPLPWSIRAISRDLQAEEKIGSWGKKQVYPLQIQEAHAFAIKVKKDGVRNALNCETSLLPLLAAQAKIKLSRVLGLATRQTVFSSKKKFKESIAYTHMRQWNTRLGKSLLEEDVSDSQMLEFELKGIELVNPSEKFDPSSIKSSEIAISVYSFTDSAFVSPFWLVKCELDNHSQKSMTFLPEKNCIGVVSFRPNVALFLEVVLKIAKNQKVVEHCAGAFLLSDLKQKGEHKIGLQIGPISTVGAKMLDKGVFCGCWGKDSHARLSFSEASDSKSLPPNLVLSKKAVSLLHAIREIQTFPLAKAVQQATALRAFSQPNSLNEVLQLWNVLEKRADFKQQDFLAAMLDELMIAFMNSQWKFGEDVPFEDSWADQSCRMFRGSSLKSMMAKLKAEIGDNEGKSTDLPVYYEEYEPFETSQVIQYVEDAEWI